MVSSLALALPGRVREQVLALPRHRRASLCLGPEPTTTQLILLCDH